MEALKFKTILFDADGVVLKSARRFSEQIEIDYGIKTAVLQPFFQGVFRECTVGRADLKDELKKVIGEWGWKGTVEELMDYWFTKGTHVDEEVVEYIQSLRERGIRCFLTTDQEKYRGQYLQDLLGHGKVFERVFYSAEIGHTKKEPAYFAFVAQELGLSTPEARKEVLFIDDDEENIEAAQSFGLQGHHYRGLEELKTFFA